MHGVSEITSESQLREVLGHPAGRAVTKERTRLHARDREWLAAAPFCLIATAGPDGASPEKPTIATKKVSSNTTQAGTASTPRKSAGPHGDRRDRKPSLANSWPADGPAEGRRRRS